MTNPKVFISYSRDDHDDAEWIQRFAESLRAQGIDVWIDTWQVPAGELLRDAVEAGLRGSDAVVTILSGRDPRNPSVLFDFGAAIGMGKRLIPIVPRDLERSGIPFGLRSRRYLVKDAPDASAREVAEALRGAAA